MKHPAVRLTLVALGLALVAVVPLRAQESPAPGVNAVFLAALARGSITARHQYTCDQDPTNCQCTYVGNDEYQCNDSEGCYACYVPPGSSSLSCQWCFQLCSGPVPGGGCIGGYHWNSEQCASVCGS